MLRCVQQAPIEAQEDDIEDREKQAAEAGPANEKVGARSAEERIEASEQAKKREEEQERQAEEVERKG